MEITEPKWLGGGGEVEAKIVLPTPNEEKTIQTMRASRLERATQPAFPSLVKKPNQLSI